jgi:hypothetical protein
MLHSVPMIRGMCVVGLLMGLVACADEGATPPSVAITSPAPGAMFTRDQLALSGWLIANIDVVVATQGDVARVSITAGGTSADRAMDAALGDVDSHGALAAQLRALGTQTVTATAYDAAGNPLATSSVDITIGSPNVTDCHAWLDLYHLAYTTGPANLGIADPITVTLPLNGLAYRSSGNAAQRKTLYGDCTLMKSLADAAPIVRAHDVTEIIDMGIYNYRCIDQTKTPPNCSMSQHSYAKAIDLAELVTSDGTHYSVLKDFVIDPAGDTCTAATENDKDAFLHHVICELKAAKTWNIILTPNYNADHRNHFHVDLTKDADFIKRTTGEPEPTDD